MKIIATLVSSFVCACSFSAEVHWDCFALHQMWDNSIGCYYYSDGRASPEIGLRCTFDRHGSAILDGKGDSNIGWNVAIWVDAVVGDVLERSYFSLEHAVLKDSYNQAVPYPIELNSSGDSMEIEKNDSFYLALIGNYYNDDGMPCDYYGWVELKNTGKGLVIQHSAFSYDSIVVGIEATPEPTTAVLLLLGCAGLLLRRRRQKECLLA